MKVLAKILFISTIVAVVAGCATDVVHVPKLPTHAQAKFLDYLEQPDNKIFVVAIDPGGNYAFGYDYGKPTLEEATKVAVTKCDANREAHGIVAKPYIYAINNDVVFEEMIFKDAEAKRQAKIEAANAVEEAQINNAVPSEADELSE